MMSMIVNIADYGDMGDKKFIAYDVLNLADDEINYLHSNLSEDTSVNEGVLRIIMYFEPKFYPFQSETAKIKMEDFIAREEIEMSIFLTSFLEDM